LEFTLSKHFLRKKHESLGPLELWEAALLAHCAAEDASFLHSLEDGLLVALENDQDWENIDTFIQDLTPSREAMSIVICILTSEIISPYHPDNLELGKILSHMVHAVMEIRLLTDTEMDAIRDMASRLLEWVYLIFRVRAL
jgi:hypothetical protein